MMKRTVFTFLAAAAICTSALVAPAIVSPAAAQASMNIGLSFPAPVTVVPEQPVGYYWGPGYYGHRWGHER